MMQRFISEFRQSTFSAINRLISSDAHESYPIQSIWCVGRNYLEHVKELGNMPGKGESLPEYPMIFLKSGGSVVESGKDVTLPAWSGNVHHEIELAVQLGADMQPVRAAVALDMTLRDVQAKLKEEKYPWTLAKAFKDSTPLGSWVSLKGAAFDLQSLRLHLTVNGKTRQDGSTADMLFKVERLVSYVKSRFPVLPGDVILTGTPHGVSQVRAGDLMEARVISEGGQVISQGSWRAVQGKEE